MSAKTINTVKLYKVTRTKCYMAGEIGTSYSLSPWGSNTEYYEGYDDGGKMYSMPEGYEVAEANDGSNNIYDVNGKPCLLVTDHDKPFLVTSSGETVLLKIVE